MEEKSIPEMGTIIPKKVTPLSAQEFSCLDKEGKTLLKKQVEESGEDYSEWEEKTKRLFPREVKLPVGRMLK